MISQRPAQANDRAVAGHLEGDLIIGINGSAIGTIVERTTRLTVLLHLPRMAEFGLQLRVKNGPALHGRGADAVKDAIIAALTWMPGQLRRSLIWDRGTELRQHVKITAATGMPVYFADPHSPWQRGTNENTNGAAAPVLPEGHRPVPLDR